MKKLTVFIFLLAFFSACTVKNNKEETALPEVDVEALFDEFFKFKIKINTLEATKMGDDKFNHILPNYISDAYQEDLILHYTEFLEKAGKVNTQLLNESQKLSLKVLVWDCRIKLDGLNNELTTIASPLFDLPSFEVMPLNQIFSLHLFISQLAGGGSLQPFEGVKDYQDWLMRLEDYLLFIDTSIAKMREGMDKGMVHPKVIIQKMIPQLDAFVQSPVEEHLYFQPVKNMPETFSDVDKSTITQKYKSFIGEKLIPKMGELQTFLREEYLPAGRDTHGLGALPNGPEAYQYLIKYHTTTNMTADEIFALGQQEVERITAEMEKVIAQIGFKGDMKEFFNHVNTRKELMPFKEPQQVIDYYNGIHEKMKSQLGVLFDLTPKGGFEVRRTEAFREASASAEYIGGTKDGSRPGVFYVPIPDVTTYNILTSEALFLHEAIPGHHYQLSLQQENENLPEFLHAEGMGVFVEGWALYTESLGKELGLYDDPYQYFGMLSQEMHRAIRLVVDTGIHAKGWTREQAIQYSLDHEAISEDGAIAEIERYMVAPGQALSYKTGQLKIRALRAKAEEALGEQFSISEFHNQVLNSGSLPLILLEEKIDNWIASVKK